METVKRFEQGMEFTCYHTTYVIVKRTRCYVTLAWDEVDYRGNVLHETGRVIIRSDGCSEFCRTPGTYLFCLWADAPDHETAAA